MTENAPRKYSREIQDTIKSSTHEVGKLLPNYARRNNGYGWEKSGIMEETWEEKHKRMFLKAVKKREKWISAKIKSS